MFSHLIGCLTFNLPPLLPPLSLPSSPLSPSPPPPSLPPILPLSPSPLPLHPPSSPSLPPLSLPPPLPPPSSSPVLGHTLLSSNQVSLHTQLYTLSLTCTIRLLFSRRIYGPHVCGDGIAVHPTSYTIATASWRLKNSLQVGPLSYSHQCQCFI